MKLKTVAIVLQIIVPTVVLLTAENLEAEEGSVVSSNDPVVESFAPGDNGQTLYSRAAQVSQKDRVVAIATYVSKAGRKKAIDHAKKMVRALTKIGIQCQIIVQTHDGKGVGFSFYANGFGVYDDDLGEKGVFSPRNAIRILPKVVAQHRAEFHPELATDCGEE